MSGFAVELRAIHGRNRWPHAVAPTKLRIMTPEHAETLAKVEVLADLEEVVHQLMERHEAKRILWFPSELLAPAPDTDPISTSGSCGRAPTASVFPPAWRWDSTC